MDKFKKILVENSNIKTVLSIRLLKIRLRLLFKFVCLSVMLYQVICVTINYFSFPFQVKLDLTYDQNKELPSVTICLTHKPDCLWERMGNVEYSIKINSFSRILHSDAIYCKLHLINDSNVINCKDIASVEQTFTFHHSLKCFTYFQKKQNIFDNKFRIINKRISYIEFSFNKSYILSSDSCYYNPQPISGMK